MRGFTLGFLLLLLVILLAATAVAAPAADTLLNAPSALEATAEPEWIDWGGLHFQQTSFIFYGPRQDLDTNPCVKVPDSVVWGRVPNGGGQPQAQQLLTGCDAPQMTWFVVDSSDVYFIQQQLNEYVLIRRTIDGSPPDEILDTGVEPQALAIDGDYVYYAKGFAQTSLELGIWRVNRNGPPLPEKIVDVFDIVDNQINRLLVDGNKIYWTEGAESAGAVRVAPKNGGAWAGIAMAGVEGAQDIKEEGNYIYWSEVGGRIMRWNKGGGVPALLHTAAEPVHHLDVRGNILVFAQGITRDGTIWRMPAGGGTAEPLVSAQPSPGPIALNSGYIYWNTSALKRIPDNADPIELDYVIDWAEVTQAIQNGDNNVPLVAQHATYVRVYSHELKGESPAFVRAALHGQGANGAALPGSPLYSGWVDVPNAVPSRADTDETFLFTLPEDWLSEGDISLELEINPVIGGQQAFETDKSNNSYDAGKFHFEPKGICVVTYPVAAVTVFMGVELVQENTAVYQQTYQRAETMLPAVMSAAPTGVVLYKANGDPFDLRVKADREELKSTMGSLAAFGDSPFLCGGSFTAVQGLVHPNAELPDNPEGGKTSGQGFSSPPVSWIQMSTDPTILDGYNSPGSGTRAAHELAHATGNGHIGCNVTVQDNSYPYPTDQLDFNDDEDSHWGYDGITDAAINPVENKDFRTYCSPKWVSDYTWKNIGDFMTVQAQKNGLLADHMDAPILTIRTQFDEETGTGAIGTGWLLEETDLTETQRQLLLESDGLLGSETEQAIVLRDAQGQMLFLQPIVNDEPHEAEKEPPLMGVTIYSDLNVLPFDYDADVIQLVDRRTELVVDEVKVSDNHPVVSGVEAVYDATDETVAVKWQARDADGDDLQYMVRYSADGGETWRVMAIEIRELNIKVSVKEQPGADRTAVVQVIATDGVHAGWGESEPFSVPKKKPKAWIVNKPQDGELKAMQGDTLSLSARGFDAEDARFDLSIFLDDEQVGSGRFLHLPLMDPGEFTVRLEVRDGDGNVARDTVGLVVDPAPGETAPLEPQGRYIFLPMLNSE